MNPSIFEKICFGLRQKIRFKKKKSFVSTRAQTCYLFGWWVIYFWFQEEHFKFVIIKKFYIHEYWNMSGLNAMMSEMCLKIVEGRWVEVINEARLAKHWSIDNNLKPPAMDTWECLTLFCFCVCLKFSLIKNKQTNTVHLYRFSPLFGLASFYSLTLWRSLVPLHEVHRDIYLSSFYW